MDQWYVLKLNPEPWRIGPIACVGKRGIRVGRDQQLAAYQEAIKESLGKCKMIEGKVRLVIYLWRNRPEYTTALSRRHRKHEADATNMQKALEDALQGVLFRNDRDVVDIRTVVVEQGPDVSECIIIRVRDVPNTEEDTLIHQEIPPHVMNIRKEFQQESKKKDRNISEEWKG